MKWDNNKSGHENTCDDLMRDNNWNIAIMGLIFLIMFIVYMFH